MEKSKVAVIVVNWQDVADTLRCLASVSRLIYPNVEAIIVDNGCDQSAADAILARHPDITLIRNGENLGYTGGNNRGIACALAHGADYVLLLNDDAVIDAMAVTALIDVAQQYPQAGFFGPKVYMLEEPQRILSAGGLLRDGWRPTFRGLGEIDAGQFEKVAEVDYLSGCALMVSRQAIETVGMLDDEFFAYHEDTEWCWRGKQAGFKVLFVPQAKVWHPDTLRRDVDSPLVTYYIARNSLLFAKKHHLSTMATARLLASYIRTLASWSIRPKWRDKRQQRDALVLALRDFLLGRFGHMGPDVARVCYGD